MSDSPDRVAVLFVCFGNICRSPMAEGIFRHMVREEGQEDRFRVDSAGTGSWNLGEPADPRAQSAARAHGVQLDGRTRQIRPRDLRDFDYVIPMDRQNLHVVTSLQRAHGGSAQVHLLRDFDPEAVGDAEVPDPYWGGPEGFDRVFEMIRRSCEGLLEHVSAEQH